MSVECLCLGQIIELFSTSLSFYLGRKRYRREITFINLGSAELVSRGMAPNGAEAVDAWLSPGAQL